MDESVSGEGPPHGLGPGAFLPARDPASAPLAILVEDDVELLELLRDIFVGDGYSVQMCSNTESARTALATWDADLLVTDAYLSGDDPLGVLYTLTAHSGKLPAVIVLTGACEEVRLAHGPILARSEAHLEAKPFELCHLLSLARSLIGWPGQQDPW